MTQCIYETEEGGSHCRVEDSARHEGVDGPAQSMSSLLLRTQGPMKDHENVRSHRSGEANLSLRKQMLQEDAWHIIHGA